MDIASGQFALLVSLLTYACPGNGVVASEEAQPFGRAVGIMPLAGLTNVRALGQPNASCGSTTAPNTPGNAAAAPGSAFNPDGTAGTQYAGQQPQNSNNPASVSQYDAACANQPN